MPLLGKEPFLPNQLPEDISPEEQVFVCKATNEAFLTYDQFFERQILCSSMVWTCSVTNKTGLTYEEAVQSERSATEVLNSFPIGLQIPILYLMNYINESKIGSIVDMIYNFVNNRYFIAEDIEIIVNTKKKLNGKVFRVIPPKDIDKIKVKKPNIDPKIFEYEIDVNKERQIVSSDQISRPKGVLTKDKIRLFLKQHLTANKRFQPMTVKESSQQKYKLNTIEWNHIFSGPKPYFEGQTPASEASNSAQNKTNKNSVSENKKNKNDDKQKTKEIEKLDKISQKEKEREQKREWNTKRDDLSCDDLRPLPKPVPIKCKIPIELFADSLFLMEFTHNFKELIDMNAIFPSGITFELMEQILFDIDIDGPFVDLIKVLLTTNFILGEEEDTSTQPNEKQSDSDDEDPPIREDERIDRNVDVLNENNSNYYYNWIKSHLGFKLSQININGYTITEVLRLHLLSSDGGIELKSKYRGLCNSREDPAIEFVAQNKEILRKLEFDSVFDLKPKERIKIFEVLIHQLLSYFEFRDKIDDSFDEMSKFRKKIRDIQMEFNKWTKDNKPINKKDSQNENQKSNASNVTNSSITEEMNEFNKEKSVKEEEKLQNIEEIRSEILKLQSNYALKPIGCDRAFRKYWIFQSLPGLFVEHVKKDTRHTTTPFGICLSMPTPINSLESKHFENDSQRDDSSTTSDKENESNSVTISESFSIDNLQKNISNELSHFDRCTANMNTCYVHGINNSGNTFEWAFYYSNEHFNSLLESLNNRGFRESELKFCLKRDKSIITENMEKCQPFKLNTDIPTPESSRRSQRLQEVLHSRKRKQSTSQQTYNEAFKDTIKEDLFILEEKLFAASLAVVTDLSRNEWRKSLKFDSKDKYEVIESLSKAILALKLSIRSMCLSVPLTDETSFQNWSQSLCESTSFSQLSVHLSVLDDSIKWSKSAREAYCKICRRKCDAQNMLLCDQCNRGHHTYCLQPSLESIPIGEWFCPECCHKFKPQTPKKDKSYAKIDYDSDYTTDDDTTSFVDSESETYSNKKTKSRSITPSPETENCSLCQRVSGELLSCAECHQFYHLNCVNVRRITRSDWFCPKCINKRPNQMKRKQNNISIDFSDDSNSMDETHSWTPPKKSRNSHQTVNLNEKIDEIEKMAINSRRRPNRTNGSLQTTNTFDFGLCEDILKKLQRHSDGWLFRNRPNHSIAPKYNIIIKQYMDFGLLVSNLNMGKYTSNLHFIRDVFLMLNNANFYNRIDSEEYTTSQSLTLYFEELLKEYDIDIKN